MDLNKLKVFKCVADMGQINIASQHLKIASSAISISISNFESELGCQLFTRHYKGMKLTSQGKKLYIFSKKILCEVDYFLDDIKEEGDTVKGELIIATSQGISSSNWFNNKLAILVEKHADLHVKIIDYKENDIDAIVADIYLCPYVYDHLELIQKKIGDVCFKLFASRHYVEKFGFPKKPADLDKHKLIAFSKELQNPFNNADSLLNIGREKDDPRDIFLHVNNTIGLLKLVKMGVGIGSLHVNDVVEHDLVTIFEEEYNVITSTYLVYNKKHKKMKNIEAFCEIFLNK